MATRVTGQRSVIAVATFAVVGAGAVGGYAGGHMARNGHDVTLIDPWPEHVEAIRRDGLRIEGVTALYRFDDALRGWGYQPTYELAADVLYRRAQAEADPKYRGIAMRDDACVYRRLVGFAVHELIRALEGDPQER